MFSNLKKTNNQSGMTFLELVVVMGIFTAISSAILFNYRDFSNSVHLQNLSQEIALQGKRAQTFASQGRRPTLTVPQINTGLIPDDWVSSYGLAFSLAENPKSFVFYFNSFDPDETDEDLRELYFWDYVDTANPGCGTQESECMEEILITDGSKIDLICAGGEPQIDPECLGNDVEQVAQAHISFTRPRLESTILVGDVSPLTSVSNVFVRVSSPDGSQRRFITFWNTGQISVN